MLVVEQGLGHGLGQLEYIGRSRAAETGHGVKKGFVNLDRDKTKDDSSYTIEINVKTEDALALVDALNVLSSTNYYLEAVAGSIMGSQGSSTASIAGSVAMLFFRNKVNAVIGDHVKLYQGVTLGAKSFEVDENGNPVTANP